MPLKNLNHFIDFNALQFLSRKELRFVSVTRWVERSETGSEIEKGVKVSLIIFKDESNYPNDKTNIGEQLVVKMPFADLDAFADFKPLQTVLEVANIQKAVVYGDYRNQLSIVADVIEVDI